MQDQNQPTVPQNEPSTKKPNLFQDWWEELYPREFLLTFKNYFFNHKKFFDEVFSEQWDDKVKPLAFLFSAIGISLIIGSISPWGLKLEEEALPPEAWQAMSKTMDSEDINEFKDVFGLHELDIIEDSTEYFNEVDIKLMNVMNLEEPPSAKDIQDYFEKEGYTLLANRAEYVNLKQQVEHDEYVKSQEVGEIVQVVALNAFVFWCMLYWLISHRFFKRANRTSRETVFVFMYGFGMLIFFVYVPFIALMGATDAGALMMNSLIVLVLLLIMTYKIFSVFKYTHNTGFFGLMIVYFKTLLVSILFGLPLLFMRKKKKALVKSS